jgi:hypothetical protein
VSAGEIPSFPPLASSGGYGILRLSLLLRSGTMQWFRLEVLSRNGMETMDRSLSGG